VARKAVPCNDRAKPSGSELKRHGSIHISSVEDRLRKIINENLDLDHEPDFGRKSRVFRHDDRSVWEIPEPLSVSDVDLDEETVTTVR